MLDQWIPFGGRSPCQARSVCRDQTVIHGKNVHNGIPEKAQNGETPTNLIRQDGQFEAHCVPRDPDMGVLGCPRAIAGGGGRVRFRRMCRCTALQVWGGGGGSMSVEKVWRPTCNMYPPPPLLWLYLGHGPECLFGCMYGDQQPALCLRGQQGGGVTLTAAVPCTNTVLAAVGTVGALGSCFVRPGPWGNPRQLRSPPPPPQVGRPRADPQIFLAKCD